MLFYNLEYTKYPRRALDSKNTQVLDLSFYRMAKDAYKSDKELEMKLQ